MTTATRRGDLQQSGGAQPTARSRIGAIVATSIAAGLIVAAVLVAAPFVPADGERPHRCGAAGFCAGMGVVGRAVHPVQRPASTLGIRAGRVPGIGWTRVPQRAACRAGCVRLGMAARPVRACCLDVPSGPPDPQPRRTVAALPGTGRVAARLGWRRLRDRTRVAGRERLSHARPADRRWRAPAAPALHRLRQPHGRPGTGWRRVLLGLRLDCAGRGPRHHSLRVRPRRPRVERRNGQPAGRDPHCRGPAHAARTRPRSRPVRAGRSLVRRSIRAKLRRAIPRSGRRHGAPGLHRTQTRPPPTDTQSSDVIGRCRDWWLRSPTWESGG